MRTALIVLAATLSAGCSHAGPYVTSISPNGYGQLLIEKCAVEYNWFMGTVSNKGCQTYSVYLDMDHRHKIPTPNQELSPPPTR